MLPTLIRQQFLSHLMSARFFAAVIITLLLVVFNTLVLIDEYERRLADYNIQKTVHRQKVEAAETYSTLELFIERPPNPLSLFSTGLEKQLGSTVEIYYSLVPLISNASARYLANPFLNLFLKIDLAFIFQVVLSLLALLFGYDAISGERETGTLRILISQPVSRSSLLVGTYIGAMICLLLPLLLSLLLILILLSTTSSIQLSPDDFLRISGIFLTTIAYVSIFYLIGLFISTISQRTATSAMLCMFSWVVLVILYPTWSQFTMNPVGDTHAEKSSVERQVNQIWEEVDREKRRFVANSPLMGKPPWFNLTGKGAVAWGDGRYKVNLELDPQSEELVPHVQEYYKTISALEIRLAKKTALIREQSLERTDIQQSRWDELLMKLSPASLYRFATAAWVGTDLDGMLDFAEATQKYHQALIDYFYQEDAFASRLWFASDEGIVDWSNLPQFHFDRKDVWVNAHRAIPELFVLFVMNLVLFGGTVQVFIRMDV